MASSVNPAAWTDCVDKVNQDLTEIQNKLSELSHQHTSRFKAADNAVEAADRAIALLTEQIVQLFRSCELKLKSMGPLVREDGEQVDKDQSQVRLNVMRSLARKLAEVSTQMRNTQRDYLTRLGSSARVATAVDSNNDNIS
eukprot:TRINITY_DN5803_c0_g2_i2.p1 TRINITY_DN5803_c0_g2~~TRINITY_DN5803_c0_g2_i2.p1  ORF type:complete len:165 (+),score=35.89 TRINITY_DN5803_c0_g2_i2:74-496(+)